MYIAFETIVFRGVWRSRKREMELAGRNIVEFWRCILEDQTLPSAEFDDEEHFLQFQPCSRCVPSFYRHLNWTRQVSLSATAPKPTSVD
jgi:hypothetical protein